MEQKRTFIHYGSEKFRKDRFVPVINNMGWSKPFGGLWACDASGNDWKDWCLMEEMYPEDSEEMRNSFSFTLAEDANVLRLENREDYQRLPIREDAFAKACASGHRYTKDDRFLYADWARLAEEGIDVIEYIRTPWGNRLLYGWDLDCILVLNPAVIVCS